MNALNKTKRNVWKECDNKECKRLTKYIWRLGEKYYCYLCYIHFAKPMMNFATKHRIKENGKSEIKFKKINA